MKIFLALLVLLPLAYSMTVDIDSLTEEQKRFLFKIPSLSDITNEICKVLSSDAGHSTCAEACPIALAAIPYGSLASALCGPACSAISC